MGARRRRGSDSAARRARQGAGPAFGQARPRGRRSYPLCSCRFRRPPL